MENGYITAYREAKKGKRRLVKFVPSSVDLYTSWRVGGDSFTDRERMFAEVTLLRLTDSRYKLLVRGTDDYYFEKYFNPSQFDRALKQFNETIEINSERELLSAGFQGG